MSAPILIVATQTGTEVEDFPFIKTKCTRHERKLRSRAIPTLKI